MRRFQYRALAFKPVGLSLLLLSGVLVVVAASAWACNPQAHLALDKDTYESGGTIIATGSYFPPDATVTISAPTATTTVRTSPGGGFSVQLTAPSTPGNYTITASRPTGGFAPASFAVVAAAMPPATPGPSPVQDPALLAPELAPQLAAPVISRPRLTNEVVYISRTGVVSLFCGRVEAGVDGSCGAVSTGASSARLRMRVRLGPKAFSVGAGRRVRMRFQVWPRVVRRIRAARRVRMSATVVARSGPGPQTTRTFMFALEARATSRDPTGRR